MALAVACAGFLFLLLAFRYQPESKRSRALERLSASSNRIGDLPPVILWAWERPEELGFINPQNTAVAFLAKTIYLRGDRAVSRPRLQPLTTPPGTVMIPVVRIEADRFEFPNLTREQVKATAAEISELAALPNIRMVQIDFDARLSERKFYRELLTELRANLPQSTALSITALASWCKGDNWLDDLPIDEAVPMLFRMGIERQQFLSQLTSGEKFNSKKCQTSAGISLDEPFGKLQLAPRVYAFNPKVWNASAVNQIMETYGQ
jgi:hypothetical protein